MVLIKSAGISKRASKYLADQYRERESLIQPKSPTGEQAKHSEHNASHDKCQAEVSIQSVGHATTINGRLIHYHPITKRRQKDKPEADKTRQRASSKFTSSIHLQRKAPSRKEKKAWLRICQRLWWLLHTLSACQRGNWKMPRKRPYSNRGGVHQNNKQPK